MFEEHASHIVAAANHLRLIVQGGEAMQSHLAALSTEEKAADVVTARVVESLRKSFITPFDRADIQQLITSMDDTIDQMNKMAKSVLLYRTETFEPEMVSMTDQIVEMAKLLQEALPMMRAMTKHANALHDITQKIGALEEEQDGKHRSGLEILLHGTGKLDAMHFIKTSQIYNQLEKVGDRFQDVAQTLNGIVVEHV
jgi:predicted phosphate transport protein (TIGR00153 family)